MFSPSCRRQLTDSLTDVALRSHRIIAVVGVGVRWSGEILAFRVWEEISHSHSLPLRPRIPVVKQHLLEVPPSSTHRGAANI